MEVFVGRGKISVFIQLKTENFLMCSLKQGGGAKGLS